MIMVQWLSLHGFVVLMAVGLFFVNTHTPHQRRHPSAAIAWLLSLALIPYVALPFYLLVGNRKLARPPPPVPMPQPAYVGYNAMQVLACRLGLPPPCDYLHFALHEDGAQSYHAMMALIDGATQTLDVCTFVLGRDALGRAICDRMAARAREGVRVRLIVDGVGRYLGRCMSLRRLRDSGVDVAIFIPPLASALPGRTNLRNHRKLVIADGERLWTGGRNLALEYFDHLAREVEGAAVWQDLTFELHGPIAQQAHSQFEQDWALARTSVPPSHSPAAALSTVTDPPPVQLLPSGPDQFEDTAYALIIAACYSARQRILVVTPYFVPDPPLRMALTLAARRGVVVDLLLPQRSNHALADLARSAALRELYTAGARIWLKPTMIHAKAMVFDTDLAFAGTKNLDERSLFLNFELLIAFYRTSDVQQFERWIDAQRADAMPFNARLPGPARQLAEGMARWLAFQL
jgi:cardiolipin synthase